MGRTSKRKKKKMLRKSKQILHRMASSNLAATAQVMRQTYAALLPPTVGVMPPITGVANTPAQFPVSTAIEDFVRSEIRLSSQYHVEEYPQAELYKEFPVSYNAASYHATWETAALQGTIRELCSTVLRLQQPPENIILRWPGWSFVRTRAMRYAIAVMSQHYLDEDFGGAWRVHRVFFDVLSTGGNETSNLVLALRAVSFGDLAGVPDRLSDASGNRIFTNTFDIRHLNDLWSPHDPTWDERLPLKHPAKIPKKHPPPLYKLSSIFATTGRLPSRGYGYSISSQVGPIRNPGRGR